MLEILVILIKNISDYFHTILEHSDPNFSISESNILFGLYFLGSFILMTMDVTMQMARVPKCDGPICLGSYITIVFTIILVFNTCLWLDLNYLLHKRQGELDLTQRKGALEEIIEEITDPVLIIIVSILSWICQKMR